MRSKLYQWRNLLNGGGDLSRPKVSKSVFKRLSERVDVGVYLNDNNLENSAIKFTLSSNLL